MTLQFFSIFFLIRNIICFYSNCKIYFHCEDLCEEIKINNKTIGQSLNSGETEIFSANDNDTILFKVKKNQNNQGIACIIECDDKKFDTQNNICFFRADNFSFYYDNSYRFLHKINSVEINNYNNQISSLSLLSNNKTSTYNYYYFNFPILSEDTMIYYILPKSDYYFSLKDILGDFMFYNISFHSIEANDSGYICDNQHNQIPLDQYKFRDFRKHYYSEQEGIHKYCFSLFCEFYYNKIVIFNTYCFDYKNNDIINTKTYNLICNTTRTKNEIRDMVFSKFFKKEFETIFINHNNFSSILHYYQNYNENDFELWEICSVILNKLNESLTEFLIERDNFESLDFEIYSDNRKLDKEICIRNEDNIIYGYFSEPIDILMNNLIEDSIQAYFCFSFKKNENGKILNGGNEIEENNKICSNYFTFYPLNNETNVYLDYTFYYNNKKVSDNKIKIKLFPTFCVFNEEYFNENKCKILLPDNDIKNLIFDDLDFFLKFNLENKIEGIDSEFKIQNIIDSNDDINCKNEMFEFYRGENEEIIQIKISNEYLYKYLKRNSTELLDSSICKNFYLKNYSKNINKTLILNIEDILIPRIDYEKIPNNYFTIKVYQNDSYKYKGNIKYYINDNFIIDEKEYHNSLKIEYNIKYESCLYNEEFKIELYKRNIFQDNSLINLNIIPFFCLEYSNNICQTNYNLNNIIEIIHNNKENILCNLNKIIENSNINENYIIQIYENKDNIFLNNFRKIYLNEECEQILRKSYSLPQNEKIIILTIEKLNEEMNYEIYDEKGNILNKSLCKSIIIINKISESLFNNPLYNNAKNLGYDIFNINSAIYNDECISYSNNGDDMILSDRKQDIFNSVNQCFNGCNYHKFIENNLVECDCDTNIKLTKNNDNFSNKNNIFISVFSQINYKPIKCYKLLLDPNKLFRNYGFWIFLFIFISQIYSIIYLYCNEYYKLYSKIYKFSQFKIVELNFKKIKSNQIGSQLSERNILFKNKTNNHSKMDTINIIHINNYPFKKAIRLDDRRFLIIFSDLILEKSLILKFIKKKKVFDLFSLNYSLFLLNLMLLFSFNGLFFSDSIISEKYHKHGLSLFINLFKSFISTLISVIIFSFLKNLTQFDNKLYPLLIDTVNFTTHNKILSNFMFHLKRKIIIYYIMICLLNLLFWYYTTLFCCVYRGNQKNWFLGGLTSLLISNLLEILLCIIIVIFRLISLKKKMPYLYNIQLYLINKL